MTQLEFVGVHHVKFLVADLRASVQWYEMVLGATRLAHLDHRDAAGHTVASILTLPGVSTLVQLRVSPDNPLRGYDPVTFAVHDLDSLRQWAAALSDHGVPHTPITAALIGDSIDFTDPDGTKIRLYTQPEPSQLIGPAQAVTPEGAQ